MRAIVFALLTALILSGLTTGIIPAKTREFLTEEEITLIQIKQRIDPRIKAYLEFASMRLKSAESRLLGEETEPGDPLEYLTPEDMLDGYYQIMNSVMLNLQDAHEGIREDTNSIRKALKELRKRTEESLRRLEFLKRLAQDREDKELLRLIGRAEEITKGAHEGAAHALEEKTYEK